MKQGDFSQLAKNYIHRTGYSLSVLIALSRYAGLIPSSAITADVGAGTGKLTENLSELGFKGFAIEPNDAMREEGIRLLGETSFCWLKGTGETTGLPSASIDWILMGSSFHWTDAQQALQEFHRVLRPGGFFVALWNPRDLESSPFHLEIEDWIHKQLPCLRRVSSGNSQYTNNLYKILTETGHFINPIFMEAPHLVEMSKDRYLGAWRSTNDIRAQAGEAKFQEILEHIGTKISNKNFISVPYKTRAWMVQAT